MKNSIGTNVILTLFGESHGEYIGATLDGLPAGIKVDEDFISSQLSKRRPNSSIDTGRIEKDYYQIISGVFNGYTSGSPLTILIKNENTKSGDYDKNLIRPSHADYVSKVKYDGYSDYRGGGHFSGRLTAPIVALGSICLKALEKKGIYIGTHILEIEKYKDKEIENINDVHTINNKTIPTITDLDKEITELGDKLKQEGDSIGGVIQTGIFGFPIGIGEPWFSSLEGTIANAVLSIGGVKGIEFGKGFDFKDGLGSSLNDELRFENGKVISLTNNNGGINGGISNGMPIIFNMAVKPTPSIAKKQQSVNLETKENVEIEIKGRHDPAIIKRVCIVITSLLAIVMCDELSKEYGNKYLK